MPTISNDEVEAEARALLREQIERTPWFRGADDEQCQDRIEQEVDAWWHLMLREAAARLLDRASSSLQAGREGS